MKHHPCWGGSPAKSYHPIARGSEDEANPVLAAATDTIGYLVFPPWPMVRVAGSASSGLAARFHHDRDF